MTITIDEASGTGVRFGKVERAWLRVHRRVAMRPSLPLPEIDLDPSLSDGERALLDAIVDRH